MKLVLRGELEQLWRGHDVFHEVVQLQGQIVREKEGRQTLRFTLADNVYYRKLHTGVGWIEIVKNLVQGRLPVIGASNEWRAINKLRELNVDTLNAVGFGQRGINPARLFSFVITKELSHTLSLAEFAKNWQHTPPPVRLKRAIIHKVADIARTIHQHGINHRDLYICHFLLDISAGLDQLVTQAESDRVRLFLVDLHRAQMRAHVPSRWLIKDVASIYFSAMDIGLTKRDIFRFLKSYYQLPLREVLQKYSGFLIQVRARAVKLYRRDFGCAPQEVL